MTKFLQKKNIFLIEYKYINVYINIYGLLDKKILNIKMYFLQHFSNHNQFVTTFTLICNKTKLLQF